MSSGQISLRYSPKGALFDIKGPLCYSENKNETNNELVIQFIKTVKFKNKKEIEF